MGHICYFVLWLSYLYSFDPGNSTQPIKSNKVRDSGYLIGRSYFPDINISVDICIDAVD